jgi:hypothetical protein
MNHEHRQVANSILSRLKDGEQFSQSVIRTALRDTGDLADNGSKGLDQSLQEENQNGWQKEAYVWWLKTIEDIEKRRGKTEADDLRRRMNEGGKN